MRTQLMHSLFIGGALLVACSNDDADQGTGMLSVAGAAGQSARAGAGGSAGRAGGSSTPASGSGGAAPSAASMEGQAGMALTGETESPQQSGGGGEAPAAVSDAGAPVATPDAAVVAAAPGTMSFFVTSRGSGQGGNFGGLAGADAFCQMLAGQSPAPGAGAKTWRAYLSTTTVNARDRIGAGPWFNFAGVLIANNVEQLHDQAANGTLNATWPTNNATIALDEQGNQVPNQPVLHDIITGSIADGTVSPLGTCGDWTQAQGTTTNGHSNRAGGMGNGGVNTSWSFSHGTGCAEPTAGQNFQQGTVSQGGGRGSIYCFAID